MDPRFIVDLNVGRLATWLRVMGYDTLFPRDASDNDLARMALKDNRILVTRDTDFLKRRAVRLGQLRMVYIAEDDLRGQLRQLVRELNLTCDRSGTRCLRCNNKLSTVTKSDVLGSIPPYVASTQDDFSICAYCDRIYWRGTHWSNMMKELELAQQEE